MTLEHKFLKLGSDIKLIDGHRIEGYASKFGIADQGGDVVERGAYSASLKRLERTGEQVKMLWQHDPAKPIGIWDEAVEDQTGLWVKGRILTNVAQGREAVALIEAGAMDGLSIGYRTVKSRRSEKGQRLLSELDLWEVSLVTFPMLPEARVSAKSKRLEDAALRDLAQALRTIGNQISGR